MLLERPGEVVSREDLKRELWPSDVFVNFEASLNSAVQKLRSALQDTSRKPRYIETLPRVGYRFIASIGPLISGLRLKRRNTLQRWLPLSFHRTTLPPTNFPPCHPGRVAIGDTGLRQFHSWLLIALCWVSVSARRNQRVPEAQAQPIFGHSLQSHAPLGCRDGFHKRFGKCAGLWLSTAFTEMLATELAAGDHLRTVAEEDVARAKLELSLANRR